MSISEGESWDTPGNILTVMWQDVEKRKPEGGHAEQSVSVRSIWL